jgi:hypothetical protein
MRDGHASIRLYGHLEHVDTPSRVVLAVKKSEFDGAEIDGFRHDALLSTLAAAWPAWVKP